MFCGTFPFHGAVRGIFGYASWVVHTVGYMGKETAHYHGRMSGVAWWLERGPAHRDIESSNPGATIFEAQGLLLPGYRWISGCTF